jgi:predicted RNA-binding Zn-ribbon protein involved in translation (DUF1610 family)
MSSEDTRTCMICGNEVPSEEYCTHCCNLANWRDVSKMNPEEKVDEFSRWIAVLQVPFNLTLLRMSQLFDRPIQSLELRSDNLIPLIRELRTGKPPVQADLNVPVTIHLVFPDSGWVEWNCPNCGAVNMDDPAQTAIPMCEACDRDVDWQDIRPKSKGYS